jgi:transcriptional regulator with XRE-family HTH domain
MTPEEMIGVRVRLARQEAGLTQAQLGQGMGRYLGSPWSNIVVSLTELGKRNVTPSELVALAAVLKRPVAWFFTLLDEDGGLTLGGNPLASEGYRALGRPESETGAMLAEFAGELASIQATALDMLARIRHAAEEMARAGIQVPDLLRDDSSVEVVEATPPPGVVETMEAMKESTGRKPASKRGGRK